MRRAAVVVHRLLYSLLREQNPVSSRPGELSLVAECHGGDLVSDAGGEDPGDDAAGDVGDRGPAGA